MNKNLILFHGKPKKERFLDPDIPKPHEANWLPYAIEEAAKLGIESFAPPLPRPYDPSREELLATFHAQPIHESSILGGHSMGGRLILEGMTRHSDLVVDKLILVAPWTDPRGNYPGLGDMAVDSTLIERARRGMTVFYSSKDDEQARESLEIVHDLFPTARFRDIPQYGHYMLGNTMKTPEFPEILEEL